jgi:hypothetical protein
VTFGPTVTVATLLGTGQNGDLGLCGRFRTDSFPRAAVNPANGNVYVTFNDRTSGADMADIFFTQSTDRGQTWSAPDRVNDDNTINDQWSPALAVTPDGARIFIGFYDRRRSGSNTDIDYFGVIGTVGGTNVTFGPNFRITTEAFEPVVNQDPGLAPDYMGDYDQAVANLGSFFVTWGDNRNANPNVPAHAHQPDVRFATIATGFVAPPPPQTIRVFECVHFAPAAPYGIGVLTTHAQFCSPAGPAPAPLNPVPLTLATPIAGLMTMAGDQVFSCNQPTNNLGRNYGIGVLTTHAQFCFDAGPNPPPPPAPAPVPTWVATPTGLPTAGLPIFRCNQFSPNPFATYGVGILTTHPQHCWDGGRGWPPAPPPLNPVPATLATDTGLLVH